MMMAVLWIAFAAAVVAIIVVWLEHVLPRLHDEEWLLDHALWSANETSTEAWVAPTRRDAEGMHPANPEARELVRRWSEAGGLTS